MPLLYPQHLNVLQNAGRLQNQYSVFLLLTAVLSEIVAWFGVKWLICVTEPSKYHTPLNLLNIVNMWSQIDVNKFGRETDRAVTRIWIVNLVGHIGTVAKVLANFQAFIMQNVLFHHCVGSAA